MFTETQAVRTAARQLVRELNLLDIKHCIEGFTFSECHLITELQSLGQATASELAEILVLEKSTISRLCDGLSKRGYLLAKNDPGDKRRKLLVLSRKGTIGADRINRFSLQQIESALGYVPKAEQSILSEGLDKYASALRYSRLSSAFSIRPIRKSDNPRVARIIRDVMTEFDAVGEGYSINDPEVDDMYGAYPTEDSAFFVITLENKVLGCAGVGPLSGADKKTCELRKMYFVNELRGTGMGTKLLNLCMDEARRLSYEICYLETLEHMTHARHLYRKHGFEPLDKPMGTTGHSSCDSWMACSL